MSGALDMGNNRITGVLNPASAQDISIKLYSDNVGTLEGISNTGDIMSNSTDMNLNKITVVADPVAAQDVVTKNYLDTTEGGMQ